MKKFFLFIFLISGLVLFSACSLGKNKVDKVNHEANAKNICDYLCVSASKSCLELSPNLCSKLCDNWDDSQKNCVRAATNCDDLYNKCQIGKDFVFEPKLDSPCSLACKNYVGKCDIQSKQAKDVNDQNVFDECLLQCENWTSKQVECVKNAELCSGIMIECGS